MEKTLGAFSQRPTTLEVRFGLERLGKAGRSWRGSGGSNEGWKVVAMRAKEWIVRKWGSIYRLKTTPMQGSWEGALGWKQLQCKGAGRVPLCWPLPSRTTKKHGPGSRILLLNPLVKAQGGWYIAFKPYRKGGEFKFWHMGVVLVPLCPYLNPKPKNCWHKGIGCTKCRLHALMVFTRATSGIVPQVP